MALWLVRPYDTLTKPGRLRRLRAVAWAGAERYELRPVRLTLVAESFNAVFRLRGDDGGDFAVRVGARSRIHPVGCEEIEAAWMTALASESSVLVAPVMRTRDHQVVVEASAPGVPEPRTCVLFGWLPGRTLVGRVTPPLAEQSGRLLAQLHAHACGRAPAVTAGVSAATAVPVADRVLYWHVPNRLGSVSAQYRSTFVEAQQRAQAAIDALWAARPHEPHLLHGDLTPYNIVKTRHGLAPIDFQDLIWGFDAQDVVYSVTPYQVLEGGEVLTTMFRRGYESIRPWPEISDEMAVGLVAGRRLHMLNLAIHLQAPQLDRYVDSVANRLAAWLAH